MSVQSSVSIVYLVQQMSPLDMSSDAQRKFKSKNKRYTTLIEGVTFVIDR